MQLPDNSTITSLEKGELPLPESLSSKAKSATVLPQLERSNIISLGQLCDDCNITLNKKQMITLKNNKVILRGIRNPKDGLWDIPIKKTEITTNCYISPSSLGALRQQQSFQKIQHEIKRVSNMTSHTIPTHLQCLGNLAIDNDFNNTIEEHKQQVARNQIAHQKANMILRKKQTHMELGLYLHAVCFPQYHLHLKQPFKKDSLKHGRG